MMRRKAPGRRPPVRSWNLGLALGLSSVLTALAPLPSWAVDYRWSNGFGQGWLEATVENEHSARLTVSCNQGAGPQYAAYSVIVALPSSAAPAANRAYTVQFVIDGRSQPFPMTALAAGRQAEFSTDARENPALREIQNLVASLRSGRSLVVEVPQLQLS